jgi:hypothetical protein
MHSGRLDTGTSPPVAPCFGGRRSRGRDARWSPHAGLSRSPCIGPARSSVGGIEPEVEAGRIADAPQDRLDRQARALGQLTAVFVLG